MIYKILVVDDERDAAEVIKNRLIREGYTALTAYDGLEALEKIKQENPDIILLDLIMPKLNGFEVLKELRDKGKDKWRPVIIVSAQNELMSLEKCYGMEADHYLTKPCDIEHILRGIRIMISLIPARIKK